MKCQFSRGVNDPCTLKLVSEHNKFHGVKPELKNAPQPIKKLASQSFRVIFHFSKMLSSKLFKKLLI